MHTFNPSIQETETGGSHKFEASLVYKVSSRTVRAIQRKLVLKNKAKLKERKKERRKERKNKEEDCGESSKVYK